MGTRRLGELTLDTLDDLDERCRGCVRWELDAVSAGRTTEDGTAGLEKEAWVSDTLLEWGTCGQIAYMDGIPVGHALYAPAAYVPRSIGFATSPVGPDAALLASLRVRPEHTGAGVGRLLIQAVARDLLRRGVRAVEAFGVTGLVAAGTDTRCLVPAGFLTANGFQVVRAHPVTPRLRLELRSLATWREDVGSAIVALDRLLGAHPPALAR